MKYLFTLLILGVLAQCASAQYQFVSPKPGSIRLPAEHNIILRPGALLDAATVKESLFKIHSVKSGTRVFNLILCDDGKTINLNPTIPFPGDDTVTVSIAEGLRSKDGASIDAYSFSFTTTHPEDNSGGGISADSIEDGGGIYPLPDPGDASTSRNVNDLLTININTQPTPGYIFFDARSANSSGSGAYLTAINNSGDSVFQWRDDMRFYDFQQQKTGYFSTYRGGLQRFDVLDSNFATIDSYRVANGYYGDPHEFTMSADGYAFLTGEEDWVFGGSLIYRTLIGSVIQEFDPHHNLIFEWRSFDNIDTNEAMYVAMKTNMWDLVHTNAIEIDTDGNILVSHRNLCQVNKIDVSTGTFIWRLGGIENEFTFINDTDLFIFQHDCRRLPNGNITLYDDGNYHHPARSFAKEYKLDEVNKTATLAWSYAHPDVNGQIAFYPSMGNVQRFPNGNTLINWGWRLKSVLPDFTEVDSAGNIVWEATLSAANVYITYRAHKYLWNPCARPTLDSMVTSLITDHSAKVLWKQVANASEQYELQYKLLNDADWNAIMVAPSDSSFIITNLDADEEYEWRLQSWCDTSGGVASHFTSTKNFKTLKHNDAAAYYLLIYPNPADDAVYLECSAHISQISIYDLLGRKMCDIMPAANEGQQVIHLSLPNLNAGNYFVEVTNDEKRDVRKVVVE